MEKWNSKKAKELGIDENLLNAVNVVVKAGRQELDALVNDVAREEEYKKTCEEVDAKRKECLESDLKVFGSPCMHNPLCHLPFIGWSPYGPDLGNDLAYAFGDIEPIFVYREIDTAVSSVEKLNSILRSLNGFVVNGGVWWLVENEEEVYSRIAEMNSILHSSIKEFDVKTKNDLRLLEHVEKRSEVVSPKELCSPEGVKLWLSKQGYNSKEERQGVPFGPNDDNSYNGGYNSEHDRNKFINHLYPYPQIPSKLGGKETYRQQLLVNFVQQLYPEKANDLTTRQVLGALFN